MHFKQKLLSFSLIVFYLKTLFFLFPAESAKQGEDVEVEEGGGEKRGRVHGENPEGWWERICDWMELFMGTSLPALPALTAPPPGPTPQNAPTREKRLLRNVNSFHLWVGLLTVEIRRSCVPTETHRHTHILIKTQRPHLATSHHITTPAWVWRVSVMNSDYR